METLFCQVYVTMDDRVIKWSHHTGMVVWYTMCLVEIVYLCHDFCVGDHTLRRLEFCGAFYAIAYTISLCFSDCNVFGIVATLCSESDVVEYRSLVKPDAMFLYKTAFYYMTPRFCKCMSEKEFPAVVRMFHYPV